MISLLKYYYYCYSDCSTAQKNIREYYPEMTFLPINSMLGKLFVQIVLLKRKNVTLIGATP